MFDLIKNLRIFFCTSLLGLCAVEGMAEVKSDDHPFVANYSSKARLSYENYDKNITRNLSVFDQNFRETYSFNASMDDNRNNCGWEYLFNYLSYNPAYDSKSYIWATQLDWQAKKKSTIT